MPVNKLLLMIGLSATLILTCGVAILVGSRSLESWSKYDPKQAAIEKISQCLDADGNGQRGICGLVTDLSCWSAIQQSAQNTNNAYSVEVLWYNWDDHIPNRGGDEVYLQVAFADGNTFQILWYEGRLELCSDEADE